MCQMNSLIISKNFRFVLEEDSINGYESQIRQILNENSAINYDLLNNEQGLTILFVNVMNLIEITQRGHDFNTLTPFATNSIPQLSLRKYLERIDNHLGFTKEIYITTSFFITNVYFANRDIQINLYNVYKLIAAFLRISEKIWEDCQFSSDKFNKACGISHSSANRGLDLRAMELINFQLTVNRDSLVNHLHTVKIINRAVTNGGSF